MLGGLPTAIVMLCGCQFFGELWVSPAEAVEASATCDYTIHYNMWLTTFEPGQYKQNQGIHGVQCLEACCQDPTCKGLAIESSLESQCYKYAAVPHPRGSHEKAQDLSSFLLGDRIPEWSVFTKRVSPSNIAPVVGLPVLTHNLQNAIASRPRRSVGKVSEELSLDTRLRSLGQLRSVYESKCEWTVFYNTWIPTFEPGEYSHDESGGPHAHCLEKCCHDPSCTGLSLESTELYQCYKYSHSPSQLDGHSGVKLGDGRWLSGKRQSWSIFIKATEPNVARPDQDRRLHIQLTNRTTKESDTMGSFLSAEMGEFTGLVPSDGWECLRLLILVAAIVAFSSLLVTEVMTGYITTKSQAMLELRLHKFCVRNSEHTPLFGSRAVGREAGSDAVSTVA